VGDNGNLTVLAAGRVEKILGLVARNCASQVAIMSGANKTIGLPEASARPNPVKRVRRTMVSTHAFDF
jgi:hypothetical protein